MSIKSNITGLDKLISKAQVNIATILKDIQKGSVNVGGVLKVFYESILNIYNLGIEYIPFITGFTSPSMSLNAFDKLSDHLYIGASSSLSSTIAYKTIVTDTTIDITNVKTLYIDWENVGSTSGSTGAFLNVSTDKTGSYNVSSLAQITKTGRFTRLTESIDVSALSGLVYIKITAKGYGSANAQINVYKVWLE